MYTLPPHSSRYMPATRGVHRFALGGRPAGITSCIAAVASPLCGVRLRTPCSRQLRQPYAVPRQLCAGRRLERLWCPRGRPLRRGGRSTGCPKVLTRKVGCLSPKFVLFWRGRAPCLAPSRSRSAEGERRKGRGARARRRPQLCLRPRRRQLLLRQPPHRSQAQSPRPRRLQLRVLSDGWQTDGGERSKGSRRSGLSARARRWRPQRQRLRPRWRRPLVPAAAMPCLQ